jgi:pyruvate dehydrogenase E1 component beta subunit
MKSWDSDVFDLRVLRPLVLDDIIESVRRTGHLIVVDTGYKTLGIGAEIIAQCVEAGLKFTVTRKGIPGHPVPSSRGYLESVYPDKPPIIDAPNKDFFGPF